MRHQRSDIEEAFASREPDSSASKHCAEWAAAACRGTLGPQLFRKSRHIEGVSLLLEVGSGIHLRDPALALGL